MTADVDPCFRLQNAHYATHSFLIHSGLTQSAVCKPGGDILWSHDCGSVLSTTRNAHQLRRSHGLRHAARGPPVRCAQGLVKRCQDARLRGSGRQERACERCLQVVGCHACRMRSHVILAFTRAVA